MALTFGFMESQGSGTVGSKHCDFWFHSQCNQRSDELFYIYYTVKIEENVSDLQDIVQD